MGKYYEGFVYEWINKINNKYYIGSHKGTPDDGYTSSGIAIRKAFKKYGIDNFTRHVFLCNNYREEEDRALKRKDAMNDPMSYNMKNDAIGGFEHINENGLNPSYPGMIKPKHSEESKKKMSQSHKGCIPWNKGKTGVQVVWNKGKKKVQPKGHLYSDGKETFKYIEDISKKHNITKAAAYSRCNRGSMGWSIKKKPLGVKYQVTRNNR